MTKIEILSMVREKISTNRDFKKREASLKVVSTVVNILFDVLRENIAKGEHIELRGFGTFETKIREPKKGINPRTKEPVEVKRRAVPIFRPGRELKMIVKENFEKQNTL